METVHWTLSPSHPIPSKKTKAKDKEKKQRSVKSIRTREYQVKCRMTKEEYEQFQKKLAESGQTQQSFLLNAIAGATIASREEVEQLKSINQSFSELIRQIKGLATNVNQMAYIANATGRVPIEKSLIDLAVQLADYKKGAEMEWQSIRQLISRQRHMEP